MSSGGPRRAIAVVSTLLGLAALVGGTPGDSKARPPARSAAAPITLPDLRILVPTDLISIGADPSTGRRDLRFTHITADVGAGPFEIDPSYDSRTGVATFTQAIYRSPSPGNWVLDHRVPVAATGEFHPPSDYQFPLTAFTLDRINPDGSPGTVVATSPKTDYCITADTMLSGVPNTPSQTFISPSNCTDPTQPLGWSVGWGDEYDQTDAGQPIDLTGVPDGTYLLRAEVDPRHVLTESDTANDVTDTTLRIQGGSVTVHGQSTPGTVLPTIAITTPRPGASLSGSATLTAAASATAPATVTGVQFLLDGRALGPVLHAPPYRYQWSLAGVRHGPHWLSARVTDSEGDMATARSIRVRVQAAPRLRVVLVRWSGGVLRLDVRGVPAGRRLRLVIDTASGVRLTRTVRGGRISLRAPRPRTLTLGLGRGGGVLVLRLDETPTLHIVNPVPGETVSGLVPVAADASSGTPIAYVRFLLDGRPLGPRMSAPPYVLRWDTRRQRRGRHTLTARALDVAGHAAQVEVTVRVDNPAPPMTCFVRQAHVSARGAGTITTPALRTAFGGEILLAFVSADGPARARGQAASVTGAGLHWRLVARANRSYGDSEIWTATARHRVRGTASATLAAPGYHGLLSVVAMEGADGVGAVSAASGTGGPPAAALRTLAGTSLVFATGNDWSQAAPRSLPLGWVLLDQWLNTQTGDTFWSQYTNAPTGRAGSLVRVHAGGPQGDTWNLAAVELVNSGD